MLKMVIKRETIPPKLLEGVVAANELVEQRLRSLDSYDITATWRYDATGSKDGSVILDLIAENRGREYAAKGYAYPVNLFLETPKEIPRGFWDQEWTFLDALSRLRIEEIKMQQARSREYEHAGAE